MIVIEFQASAYDRGLDMGEYIWTKSKYKFFQSQWGIVIWLEAGWKIVSDIGDKGKYMEVTDRIYFQPMLLPYPDSQNLTADELQCFCDGLKLISKFIQVGARGFIFDYCPEEHSVF